MDEKTEELRDIFMDVTDEDTVTESQEETRGSLMDDDSAVRDRLESVIASMRERYAFATGLDDAALCRLVHDFYEGASDADIAAELGVEATTVFEARMDLHLFRDADTDAPFDVDELRNLLAEGASDEAAAATLGSDPDTVAHYRRVIEAKNESRRANDRYRDEFDSVLADADLASRMTEDVQEDGLDDATEGMETDVSF